MVQTSCLLGQGSDQTPHITFWARRTFPCPKFNGPPSQPTFPITWAHSFIRVPLRQMHPVISSACWFLSRTDLEQVVRNSNPSRVQISKDIREQGPRLQPL